MTAEAKMILLRAVASLRYLSDDQKRNLVRLTAAYAENHVRWQVVVLDDVSEDELDEYDLIFTEVLADFQTATGEDEVFRVKTQADAAGIEPLTIAIFPIAEKVD